MLCIKRVPEPGLLSLVASTAPGLIRFTDKTYTGVCNRGGCHSLWREFFKIPMTVLMPVFSVLAVSNPGAVASRFADLLFNTRLTGRVRVSELKHALAVTATESTMSFRVLTMTVNLSRLTTGTMNINAGDGRSAKMSMIQQIQLIRGITDWRVPTL